MTSDPRTVVALVPGQGAYSPSWARGGPALVRHVHDVCTEIDAVTAARGMSPIATILNSATPLSLEDLLREHPDRLQLCVYALSVAAGRAVREAGVEIEVFIGHSLGEIAALSLAGAFDTATGATIIVERIDALAKHAPRAGGMLALSAPREWVDSAIAVLRRPLTLAVSNSPAQQVISGSATDIAAMAELARAARVAATRLASPYGFHNPDLADARSAFSRALSSLSLRTPAVPVYSPILGRFYRAGDDLAAALAEHLVLPVDFHAAVSHFCAAGQRTYVELGSSVALSGLVRRIEPRAFVATTWAPDASDAVLAAAQSLATSSGRIAAPIAVAAPVPAPMASSPVATAAVPTQLAPAAPVTATAPPKSSSSAVAEPVSRDQVLAQVRDIYAGALEYPVEVFTEDVELEADLGVDSVKQTELIGRLREVFALPAPPEDFRMSSVARFGQVVDMVMTNRPSIGGESSSAVAPSEVSTVAASGGEPVSRDQVLAQVRDIYAGALEYPVEVFTEDVELEADLGVDSVKQTELIGRLREVFALPAPPEDFRMSSVARFGQVVDMVLARGRQPVGAQGEK